MKKNSTELVFILDRSGSMSGLEDDTIGGYNALLEKQRKEEGACLVTTVLFDNEYELLHNRIDLKGIENISDKDYFVRGSTALIDAIGKSLNSTINNFKKTKEEERPDKVLFVIITDGYENASREYSSDQVKKMIEKQKKKYNWEFIFLGANIDSVETGARFGIGSDMAIDYMADEEGIRLNYEVIGDTITNYRREAKIDTKAFDRIRSRKNKA